MANVARSFVADFVLMEISAAGGVVEQDSAGSERNDTLEREGRENAAFAVHKGQYKTA